jgi:NAD(P)-dependent dehydrogenase (short-subunit alcohol dehydrogenase family)
VPLSLCAILYTQEHPVFEIALFMSKKLKLSRRRLMLKSGVGLVGITTALTASQVQAKPQQPISTGKFADRVVLITGATSGIGEATAREFAKEGAIVHFCGRRKALGLKVQESIIAAGGRASYQQADVRNESDLKALVDECVRRYGKIDIAFNNAGIESPSNKIADLSAEDWDNVVNTNARGVFLAMKYELAQMVRQGGGCIVNTASIAGHRAFSYISPYNASKFAIVALTKAAALEYTGKNIRINVVSPGWVDTPLTDRVLKVANMTREQAVSDYPSKRMAKPEEIAQAVMWLSSPEASYVSGEDFAVDGGGLG